MEVLAELKKSIGQRRSCLLEGLLVAVRKNNLYITGSGRADVAPLNLVVEKGNSRSISRFGFVK